MRLFEDMLPASRKMIHSGNFDPCPIPRSYPFSQLFTDGLDGSFPTPSDRAFADDCNSPTFCKKFGDDAVIPCAVALDLGRPEFRPGAGNLEKGAAYVPMPETAVEENHRPSSPKDNIGLSGQCVAAKRVTKPEAM
jgi:hypothetical protein